MVWTLYQMGDMKSKLEIRVESVSWSPGVRFLICEQHGDRFYAAPNIIMDKVEPNESCDPSGTLSKDSAQALMDNLWSMGFRPGALRSSDAEVTALKGHLADMQRLVFNNPHLIDLRRIVFEDRKKTDTE